MMKLEEKLVRCRREKGLSQLELAEAVGVSRQAVSRWETGQSAPTYDNLKRLGEVYGVTVDYLINDDAEKPSSGSPECSSEPRSIESGKKGGKLPRWASLALAAAAAAMLAAAVTAGICLSLPRESKETPTPIRQLQNEPAPTEFGMEFDFDW